MIVERLTSAYEALIAEEAKEPGPIIRPSKMGGCLRELAFLLAGHKPEPLRAQQRRVFELGHQRGAALAERAKAIWPDAQTEVRVTIPMGRFSMVGHIDLWIPSERTIVDFKTQSVFGFDKLDTEGVSMEYQLQVHAYRHGIWDQRGSLYEDSAPLSLLHDLKEVRCVLVYEAKDADARKGIKAQDLKELEVPYTDELEEAYQKRLMELEGLLIRKDQGSLDPSVVPGLEKSHWRCRCDKATSAPLYCQVGPRAGGCHG